MLNLDELKTKSISEIKSFLKENGSVFVERHGDKLKIQHLYVSNGDIKSLEISSGLKFKQIKKDVWFLEYTRDYVENICYYLFKDCENLKGTDRDKNIIDDPYAKNKLDFCNENGEVYFSQNYVLPVPKIPNFSLKAETHKVYSDILKKEYEILVAYPKNFGKNKSQKCLIVTDGGVWHYSMHLAEQINEIDNFLVCFVMQQDRNVELPNKDFAKFVACELTAYLTDKKLAKSKQNLYFWGQSFGGLTALYIDEYFSDFIGNIICSSPSLWFKNNKFLDYYKENAPKTNFHLSYGNADFGAIKTKTKILAEYIKPLETTIFKGGHDYVSWDLDFLNTIRTLKKQNFNNKKL